MPIPKPKSELQLDEDDWIDIERTNITIKHRMQSRRDKNALYERALAMKARGELLSGEVDDEGTEGSSDES
jgi:hypothetical protein